MTPTQEEQKGCATIFVICFVLLAAGFLLFLIVGLCKKDSGPMSYDRSYELPPEQKRAVDNQRLRESYQKRSNQ